MLSLVAAISLCAAQGAPPPPQPSLAHKSTLAVIPVDLDPTARREAVYDGFVAEGAALRNPRFGVKDLARALDPGGARQRDERYDAGVALMKSGRQHYDNLELDQAIQDFDHAAAAFEKSDLSVHFRDWVRAVEFRVAARFVAGDAATAKADLARLAIVDPRLDFDKNLFGPDVIAAAQDAKRQLRDAQRVDFDLKSEPVSARVYVDGVFVDASPVTLKHIPIGEHFVTVIAPGFQPWQDRVRVSAGLNVRAVLEGTDAKARYLSLLDRLRRSWRDAGPDRGATAQELGKWLGVDEVLMVAVARDSGNLLVSAIRSASSDEHILAFADEAIAENDVRLLQRLDQIFTTLLATDRPREGGKAVTVPTAAFKWKPSYTAWSLVGAGAAGLAVGGTFGLLAYQNYQLLGQTAQRDPTSASIKDSGKTEALVADAVTTVGLVAGITGGYLLYKGRQVVEPSPVDDTGTNEPPPPGTVDQPSDTRPKDKKKEKPPSDDDDPFGFDGGGVAPLRGGALVVLGFHF